MAGYRNQPSSTTFTQMPIHLFTALSEKIVLVATEKIVLVATEKIVLVATQAEHVKICGLAKRSAAVARTNA